MMQAAGELPSEKYYPPIPANVGQDSGSEISIEPETHPTPNIGDRSWYNVYLEYFLNPPVLSIAVIKVSRTTHEFLSPYNSLVLMLASLDVVNRRGKGEGHPY